MLRPLLRRLLLPILFLIAAAASAQTVVTFTISGTMAGAPSEGYNTNDPITFTFALGTGSTPSGYSNPPFVGWANDNSHPLFSSVSATGLTGTWNGTDSSSGLTDDEIVINTTFNSLTLQTAANTGDLHLTAPDGTHLATFIYIQAQWSGLSLPNSSISDPVAYFAARTGTYSFVPGSDNVVYSFDIGSANFHPSTLTISAIPEPETDAAFAGLGVLLFAFVRRRRKAA